MRSWERIAADCQSDRCDAQLHMHREVPDSLQRSARHIASKTDVERRHVAAGGLE